MSNKMFKVAKVVVPLVSIAVSFAANYLNNKELDDKIAQKVSEALANVGEEA